MINVNISLYGAFRRLGVQQLSLEISDESTVADLRDCMAKYLENIDANISVHLVKTSAFATDERVLKEEDRVAGLKCLAILPPVCGG
ncbi:MAG TPA: hypothetical protein VIG33_11120 [Pseudobdellovibrionaceae bacterium]